MTARTTTATEHLRAAQDVLDRMTFTTASDDLARVRDHVDRAVEVLQLARANATAALDEL